MYRLDCPSCHVNAWCDPLSQIWVVQVVSIPTVIRSRHARIGHKSERVKSREPMDKPGSRCATPNWTRAQTLRIGAEIDPEFMVAEVARLWPLDMGKTKLWRVRLHRANTGIISAAIQKCDSEMWFFHAHFYSAIYHGWSIPKSASNQYSWPTAVRIPLGAAVIFCLPSHSLTD